MQLTNIFHFTKEIETIFKNVVFITLWNWYLKVETLKLICYEKESITRYMLVMLICIRMYGCKDNDLPTTGGQYVFIRTVSLVSCCVSANHQSQCQISSFGLQKISFHSVQWERERERLLTIDNGRKLMALCCGSSGSGSGLLQVSSVK